MNRRKPEIHKIVKSLLVSGATVTEIAATLSRPVSSIAYYVKVLGWAKPYLKAAKTIRGLRVCSRCGASKSLSQFPSPRNSYCSACKRNKKSPTPYSE